eukprot:408441_1
MHQITNHILHVKKKKKLGIPPISKKSTLSPYSKEFHPSNIDKINHENEYISNQFENNISNEIQSISLNTSYNSDNIHYAFNTIQITEKQVDEDRQRLLNLNKQIQTKNDYDKQYDNNENKTSNENPESQIVDVWSSNLKEAMRQIQIIIEKYPYIAVDTEFPGVVSRLKYSCNYPDWTRPGYKLVADNVNRLKLIQVGLAFYNEKGETPSPYSTYQFNFEFNISRDMFATDSIVLLINSGIDFNKLNKCGIQHNKFAEIFTMSGLVLNDDVTWICFHGSYDFAYLVKTLCCKNLPIKESDFLHYLQIYFPSIYDLKILLNNIHSIKAGGLQALANILNIKRIGQTHMAGSDSLLTGDVFFKFRELYFDELIDERIYLNTLYGFSNSNFAHCYGSDDSLLTYSKSWN